MKKLAAVILCVGLCIAIGVLYPQVGTSNPNVDDTGCLVSGCHDAGFGEDSLNGVHVGWAAIPVMRQNPVVDQCLRRHALNVILWEIPVHATW